MSFKKKFFLYLFVIIFNFNFVYSFENKILLKVDNELITTIDLYNETNYLIALNQNLKDLEKNKIFEIAKNSLIKEKIKTKEILKYTDKLTLEDKYLNKFIASIYQSQNLVNLNQFIDYLNKQDVDIEYLKKRISIEIIWNDLIVSKFSNKIQIDDKKIKNDLIKNLSKKSKEYFLSEIFFDVSLNTDIETKTKLIETDIIEKGFKNAVLIHSISNSSTKNGGEIGWINENSLNKNVKDSLNNLNINDHTKPITVPGGFLILNINDIRFVENKNFDVDKKLNEIISLKRNEQLNNYSNIYFNKIKKEFIINDEL